jgi:hypothetical protein
MSVAVTYAVTVTTVETLETSVPAASANGKAVTHSGFNRTSTALTSSTTPPVTKCSYMQPALSAGAYTINLTTLTGTNGATVTMSGLKVQVLKIKNNGANVMSFTEGASNGYALLGASFLFALQPGQEITLYGNDATPDVAAGDCTIDVTGTGTQSFDLAVIAG